MALTAAQLADLQSDLGIDATQAVFTDAELQRLFDRAAEDYNTSVYLAWRQLLGASAKWIDYRVAQTEEKRSQAFDHIKAMVAFWGDESRTAANQMRMVGLVGVPTLWKEEPAENERERRRVTVRR